jgi:hypothetical protein
MQHPVDYEPSLIGERTYVTRRRFMRVDAPVLLSLMICLLTLFPAQLVVPGLTDLGRPGMIVAFLMFFWWITTRLNPRLVLVGPQPIRWPVLAFMVSMLLSYAVGMLRGLTLMESNAADRWMLMILGFIGVILLSADGIPNWERLNGVMRVFVWCCTFMAVVGLLQAFLRLDLTPYLKIPGLTSKGWVVGTEIRGEAVRVASTAFHYIEFATMMAMALPFAIHFARFSPTSRQRQLFTLAALLIAGAIPVTTSRTGYVALIIVVLVLFPMWNWRLRYNMAAVGVILLAAITVAKPGLISTVSTMFFGAGEDPSITARTERYKMVGYFFEQRPWFGRGTGTWVSPQYQYLDNQWLALALTNGVIGVAALAALHITAIVLAILALRRSESEQDRHFCAALVAVQLIGVVVAATFDSFSFSTYATTLPLMIGVCGAVWRFTHPARTVRTATTRWFGN